QAPTVPSARSVGYPSVQVQACQGTEPGRLSAMDRRPAVALVVVGLLAGGSAAGCAQAPSPTLQPAPSGPCSEVYMAEHPGSSAPLGDRVQGECRGEDLVLSGGLVGRVGHVYVANPCETPLTRGENLPSPVLQFVLRSQPYSLMVTPPATYDRQPVTFS